jgi:hypothetical protein
LRKCRTFGLDIPAPIGYHWVVAETKQKGKTMGCRLCYSFYSSGEVNLVSVSPVYVAPEEHLQIKANSAVTLEVLITKWTQFKEIEKLVQEFIARLDCARTIKTVQKRFADFGFPECPLSETEIAKCREAGFTTGQIYLIGCDVDAGYPFAEAVAAMK